VMITPMLKAATASGTFTGDAKPTPRLLGSVARGNRCGLQHPSPAVSNRIKTALRPVDPGPDGGDIDAALACPLPRADRSFWRLLRDGKPVPFPTSIWPESGRRTLDTPDMLGGSIFL